MAITIKTNISNATAIEWDNAVPTFYLELSGSSTDLSYLTASFQWFYESSSLTDNTSSGEGSSSLTFANANISESAGRYWCAYISESVGGTSSIATLTITPALTANLPATRVATEWDQSVPAIFNAYFTGSGALSASYVWYRDAAILASTNVVSASGGTAKASSASLQILVPLTSSNGSYSVIFASGSEGHTSSVSVLTVQSVIKTQPAFGYTTINDWESVNLSVVLTGSGATSSSYQWQRPSGTNISNATKSLLTSPIIASNFNQYRVLIQSASYQKTSSIVAYTDSITPPVIVQPTSSWGDMVAMDGATIVLGGENISSSITRTYQWYRNGTAIAGATAATYTIENKSYIDMIGTYTLVGTTASGSSTTTGISVVVFPPGIDPTNAGQQMWNPYEGMYHQPRW